jgi:hypothetical protein
MPIGLLTSFASLHLSPFATFNSLTSIIPPQASHTYLGYCHGVSLEVDNKTSALYDPSTRHNDQSYPQQAVTPASPENVDFKSAVRSASLEGQACEKNHPHADEEPSLRHHSSEGCNKSTDDVIPLEIDGAILKRTHVETVMTDLSVKEDIQGQNVVYPAGRTWSRPHPWIKEISALFISWACQIALVVIPSRMSSKPLYWTGAISLNTLISTLTTLSKGMLLLPVTASIS